VNETPTAVTQRYRFRLPPGARSPIFLSSPGAALFQVRRPSHSRNGNDRAGLRRFESVTTMAPTGDAVEDDAQIAVPDSCLQLASLKLW
jgi:hypothetical protein